MSPFNVIAQTEKNTVVAEYITPYRPDTHYQSEKELENDFIHILTEQGYEYLAIHQETDLINNLRLKLEELNKYKFSDSEWKRFFNEYIANSNEDIKAKTKKIQEESKLTFIKDDGSSKNIILIDKNNIHNNSLQVINQYTVTQSEGARHNNRYDVTILINGLPIVHIELKRRGVALREAFNQIERYQRNSFSAGSGLFQYIQIFVISNGKNTKYYSNTTRYNAVKNNASQSGFKEKTSNSFEFTSFWSDEKNNLIPDLVDFARTFFAKHTILNIITKYCIFTVDERLLVMRPYQIAAVEKIINRIDMSEKQKTYGSIKGGGYIWHTTGSGKTLTSFKTARIASKLPYIDKVLFVVDRKDLDYQTMKEYDKFEEGAANSNTSTAKLQKQLEDSTSNIIITTIQKLSIFIKKNKNHSIYSKRIVIIFDECHRSHFGEMHTSIIKNFKKYNIFGFTGTPIFPANSVSPTSTLLLTTDQTFGLKLHTYTIVDAIRDKNVLPFKIDYTSTMRNGKYIVDENVEDIDREKAFMAPKRIEEVTTYILEHFNQHTYRNSRAYNFNKLNNITETVSNGKISEERKKTKLNGFNSIFAVSSIPMAKMYYEEFQKQMKENPSQRLKVALIYSFAANEEDPDEEPDFNPEPELDSRDFLEQAIQDYNEMFSTNYDTSPEKFQNYYRDVSLRMKNKDIDILIVVNMFLTGFDATTLNTLWVDKNLKQHGLIQAFSRTNRILNSVKAYGNIVCFRPLDKEIEKAISMFGDKNAGGIVQIRSFKEYLNGFESDGKKVKGYKEIVEELQENYPIIDLKNIMLGEESQKEFIRLFGLFLKMRNILSSFDDFETNKILSDRDLQDYLAEYQDLHDEWKSKERKGELTNVNDDIVFEVELIKQIEINIDYILMLVQKYHKDNCKDAEIRLTIKKTVEASPELRSKKKLIENFINKINDIHPDDFFEEWNKYIIRERERAIKQLLEEEKDIYANKIYKFLEDSYRIGEIQTIGLNSVPSIIGGSMFSKNRPAKINRITDKLCEIFEKLFINTNVPYHIEDYI